MHQYRYREPSGYTEDFQAENATAAAEYAKTVLRGGDWDPAGATLRLHATVAYILPTGEDGISERVTVLLEPVPPPCSDTAGHTLGEFSTSPVDSSGGVQITEQCRACGVLCTLDTGAVCRDCGDAFTQTIWQPAPPTSWEDFTWRDLDDAGVNTNHVSRQQGGGDDGEDLWVYREHGTGTEIIWRAAHTEDGTSTHGYHLERYEWTGQPENSGWETVAEAWEATVPGTLALVAQWAAEAKTAASAG